MQRAAVTDATRSVGQRSVLHFPSHGKAVLRGGFLSIQASGFLLLPHPFGKVLSVFLCHAGQCLLLRGSVPSLVWISTFSCVNQWRGRCGLPQWKWRGDGTVELGAAGRGFSVGGFGEIDRCFEKRSAAGWIDPTAALACAERQGFEPWIQSPVCRISSAVHSTTLASLLFGECCSACAMRPRVVVEAVEQSLSKRKVTATFSFQQALERKSVPRAGCFYFPGRWFVLSEQRLSSVLPGVLGFPSRLLFLFRQKSEAFRAEYFSYPDRGLRLSERSAFPIQTEVLGFPSGILFLS